MLSPFAQVASSYAAKGLSVIPIKPDGKAPGNYSDHGDGKGPIWGLMNKWNYYESRCPTEFEIKLWSSWPDGGIGIPLGTLNGIIALDFDWDIDGLHAKILDLIEDSPIKKTGAKGFTAFYRYNGEKNGKWSKEGQSVIELLSSGRQTVLPATIHPDTKRAYVWLQTETLIDFDLTKLPLLPDDFYERMNELFERGAKPTGPTYRPVNNVRTISDGPSDIDRAAKALDYIDPDDYHTWIEVGMCLKVEFKDAGFDLWDSWSSRSTKYRAKDMPHKWQSFHRTDKTIASVFYLAQQNGFINIPERSPSVNINDLIIPGGNMAAIVQMADISEPKNNRMAILDAPGTVGAIAQWITKTAIYPQPALAMAAALALMGVVKGHRVSLDSGLRTNIYTMGVTMSGGGKDHAIKCLDRLLFASDQSHLLGGKPASSAGMFKALREGNGRRLLQMDEFGRILATLTGKNVQPHQSGITTLMVEVFSRAAGIYLGTEYANADGKRNRADIEQPCLCVHAVTVPSRLYESMTSMEAIDGFLSRWLIFEETEFVLDDQDGGNINSPPDAILEDLNYWKNQPTNIEPLGDIDKMMTIRPKIIKFSGTAEQAAKSFRKDMRFLAKKEFDKKTGFEAIYNRVTEHALKLALIAFEGEMVSNDVFDWACKLSLSRADYLCRAIGENISDNDSEAELKRVLRIITGSEKDGITQNQLVRRTQFLKKIRRAEICQDLVDSNQIICYEESTGKRKRIIYKDFTLAEPGQILE